MMLTAIEMKWSEMRKEKMWNWEEKKDRLKGYV